MTKSIGMIVAGEVGPAETRLALCGLDVGRPIVVAEDVVANQGVAGLASMVQRFLQKYRPPQIRAAGFVVAGPVRRGASLAAGLPWPVDARALASELALDRVALLSDAEAIAYVLPALAPDELVSLSGSDPTENGNQAVLSVGVATSVAASYWNGTEHRSFASEAASADFAPSTDEELRLAQHLSAGAGRVSLGAVLSRAGLVRIHAFVREKRRDPPALAKALQSGDAAAAILREATEGSDDPCRRAVLLFLGLCGAAARNVALAFHATGGVYLAGDIVPELRAAFAGGAFGAAFGREALLSDFVRDIPVHAVLNPKAALLGAATVAARELRTTRGSGWAS